MAEIDGADLWESWLERTASPILAVAEKSLIRISIDILAEFGKDVSVDAVKDFMAGLVSRFALIPPILFLADKLHMHISFG